jgi:hypothetical protein
MLYPMWGKSFLAGTAGPAALAVLLILSALSTCGLGFVNAWLLGRAQTSGGGLVLRFLNRNAVRITVLPLATTVILFLIACTYAVLTHPFAVSTMVHTFTWLLATCGVALVVQAVAAYSYAAGFDILSPRRLRAVAYVYAASSWLPVVAIAAISSFMLTPGRWLATFGFWDALINPTFAPLLVLISVLAIGCGSALLALTISCVRNFTEGEKGDLERMCIRPLWLLVAAAPIVPLYFMSLPETLKPFAFDLASFPSILLACCAAMILLAATVLGASLLSGTRRLGTGGSLASSAALLAAVACFFMFQTAARAPFAISDYIYSNDIAVADLPRLRREGLLNSAFRVAPTGTDFARVPARVRGRWIYETMSYSRYPALDISRLLSSTASLSGDLKRYYLLGIILDSKRLPPFAGTAGELEDLIEYLSHPSRKEHDG